MLPARAVSRSLATTPTSRPHDLWRRSRTGRRGCLIRPPVAWCRGDACPLGLDRLLVTYGGSKRLPAADDQAADAHRRSSDRADVAVAPTRFRRTTTSLCLRDTTIRAAPFRALTAAGTDPPPWPALGGAWSFLPTQAVFVAKSVWGTPVSRLPAKQNP